MILESKTSKPHGRRSEPWNGEPGKTTEDVPWKSRNWRRRNGLVVVPVVEEDSAEVADNIDDEEDRALLGAHGEIAASSIAVDRMPSGGLEE